MTEAEFKICLGRLRELQFREDFQTLLGDFYTSCDTPQRAEIRRELAHKTLTEPVAWKNPTDYFRSDLTPPQRSRQSLLRMSMYGHSRDTRDDLRSLAGDYHTLLHHGLDADATLKQIAILSDGEVAAFIHSFLARDAASKSLKAFGLVVVNSPAGPLIDTE
jgi:hypothetical protein